MPEEIDILSDRDNPSTVCLSRWPDEAEKTPEFDRLVANARSTTPVQRGDPQSTVSTGTGTLTGNEPSGPVNGSEGLGDGGSEDQDPEGFSCGECDHVPFKTAGALTTHRRKHGD